MKTRINKMLEVVVITTKHSHARLHKWVEKESFVNIAGWAVTLAISVAFMGFIVGVFPVYPSVIATGSMKPIINVGDVILIKKAMKDEAIYKLRAGDIIQFTRDDILIIHRILKVIEDKNGNVSFQTKGDNNSLEDARLVLPKEVKGTLITTIPKVGIPTLWIKSRKIKIVLSGKY